MTTKRIYSDFVSRIDVDAFEEAIGFVPIDTDRNNNDVGFCPDPWGLHKHGDTTGKFAIHRDKRVYNCWVCGGGSLLSLAMAIKDCEDYEAADWLYQFASEDTISSERFVDEIEMELADEGPQETVLPYFNARVLDKHQPAYEWGLGRGISNEVIDYKLVKFDPSHTRRSRKGEEHEGPAVILPHFWQGKLVGWQERWFDAPKWIPKYTNTQDFPRKETIYNYEPGILADPKLIVCESVPTVLALMSRGIPAMATFGSNLSQEHIRLLRRCINGITIAPDNDDAGAKYVDALYEGLERYIPLKLTPRVGEPNSGGDLGDLANDQDALIECIEAAEDL